MDGIRKTTRQRVSGADMQGTGFDDRGSVTCDQSLTYNRKRVNVYGMPFCRILRVTDKYA